MTQDLLKVPQREATLFIEEGPRSPEDERVFCLRGSIDADGAPILSEKLEALLMDGDPVLVLDLRQVTFISSSGIGALVTAIAERRDEGGDLILEGVSPSIHEVFGALDLLDYVNVRSTS